MGGFFSKMPLQRYEKVRCISCHYRCELNTHPTIKMMNCVENQYGIWPSDNTYLQLGIRALLLNTYYNLTYTGIIFVDFSKYKLKLYTNKRWIDHLKYTGLRLILVSDSSMQPLASYWKKNYQQIVAIINTTDSYAEVERKIKFSFLGRRDMSTHRNRLTELELKVLNLFISEYSIKGIATTLNIPTKKVYSIKRNLQHKMGGRGRLNTMISG